MSGGDSGGMADALSGRRILVVGASSGIGRATAVAAVRAGSVVALAARRADLLEAAAADAGPSATAVPGDVADAGSCGSIVARSAEAMGGIDAVVFATAVTHLAKIESVEPADWRRILDTNVVGASLIAAAALPHLREGWGRLLALSSDAVGHPFPGLGAYVASKAALESVIESWRIEHRELDVIKVIAGPTATDAASAWDPDLLGPMLERWVDGGYVRPDLVPAEPGDVAIEVLSALAADPVDEVVDLAPPRPWA